MPRTLVRGIRANLPQFALLIGINGLVGALVGQERSLIPLLAERQFGIASGLATSLFLVTFGLAKAPSNLIAGLLAERFGPKRVLIAGWLVGTPVPLLLMWAPSWGWVIAANLLLGVNQGLTWSTTVLMKIQLAGDHERGRAVGLNEFAGYAAVGLSAFASGLLADRFGIRPEPFLLGLAVVLGGALLSSLVVRDTPAVVQRPHLQIRPLFRDRLLRICTRTGLINNANDAFAWALLPLLLTKGDFSTAQIAAVVATYPIVWGVLQLITGPLSDRVGRRAPIGAGMLLQAGGLAGFTLTQQVVPAIISAAVLGLGTALAYPALIAAAADLAPEHRRPAAIGFFRMGRDSGYVIGALVFGSIADLWGLQAAAAAAATITAIAGIDAMVNLREKHSSERLIAPTMPS
ncbi:MAG: MFS transporter [Actinobacteria bacterium]|nr:MFS transporter [Actinomycetota bacterium]